MEGVVLIAGKGYTGAVINGCSCSQSKKKQGERQPRPQQLTGLTREVISSHRLKGHDLWSWRLTGLTREVVSLQGLVGCNLMASIIGRLSL